MQTFDDINPSTGEVLAQIPITSSADLQAAVARAQAAQPAWAAMELSQRLELLGAIGGRLEQCEDELADLITREMGKPRAQALGEVRGYAKQAVKELEEVALAMEPEYHETSSNSVQLIRAPLGVVAAITPWNFPLGMPLQILLPALGTGNTVVFKPSELVPLVGAKIAELLAEGLPTGVLELVQGDGALGAELVASDIQMVGFVGSRETGKKIMQSASGELKRLVLELGGKDPLVVMGDADLESAADCAVRHSLRNSGQVCCSIERVYVADSIADEFEKRVVEKAKEWSCGDGFDDNNKMGPMVSATQRDKVAAQVETAVATGARVAFRGEAPQAEGFFYAPLVLVDVGADHAITHEETFGPVVSLTRFSGDEEEGVRLANDTPYGLGANVYTGDVERGVRMAKRIHAGQVGVNQYLGGAPGLPWVGARQSGYGFLGGVEGHRQFTVPKSIAQPKVEGQ
ncbi:MAG: succinate-semialdehyde dehydrogenase/glutarate-semialdehyde dehydrogenase [Candidatus Paceibacteria bacterium]|jgi:succinate-semialdehyde dehydrogenase/glutarate-semialdehyde dehydrogenase